MNRISFLSFLIFPIFLSCSETTQEGFIDPEFQSYIDKFVAEAALRGDTIDIIQSGLSVIFEDDGTTTDYAGVCRNRFGSSSNEIGIEKGFWEDSNESTREWLIFHELGHCVLGRDHDNSKYDNGMWKSLMRGGELTGIDTRQPLCYIWDRQAFYLDELFDENVEAPEWIINTYQYENKPQRSEELISLDAGTLTFDNYLITPILNFELEYSYLREDGEIEANILYGDSENRTYHFVSVDHKNNEIRFGNEIQGCMQFPFDDAVSNKVTIRQKAGSTSLFINEEFIHSYPAYKNPITRFRNTGDNIVFQEFKMWGIN